MKIKDKVIIVTGGGNGVGRELVLNLLSKEAKVITVDINETALQETAKLAGKKQNLLTTFVIDITNKASIQELFEKSIAIHNQVDGIINNAGIIQYFKKLNTLDFDEIERVMNINFYGTLYMTKIFLPHLLIRPEAHIVNISSMGGFLPVPGQTIYGASKAAVKLMTEGLKSELSETNVNVTVVFPGAIQTNIKKNSGLGDEAGESAESTTKKLTSPAKAAEIIINAIEKNKSRIFIGKDSKYMDIIYRLKPKWASKFIYNKMKDKI
jgi:short-subunit dehydrogenase